MKPLRLLLPALATLVAAAPAAAQAPSVEIEGFAGLAAPDDSVGTRYTGGGEFLVRVRGESDSLRPLRGSFRPPSQACPAQEDDTANPLSPHSGDNGSGFVQGPFDVRMISSAVASGRWRACVYLQDNMGGTLAMDDEIVETFMAPRRLSPPTALVTSYGTRRSTVRCRSGDWLAWPRPKVSYAWRVNGRLARRARRSRLTVRTGSKVACRVTARNSLGRKSAWSKTRRAR